VRSRLTSLLLVLFILAPGVVQAEESAPADEPAMTEGEVADARARGQIDDLGRVFPDPFLLQRSRSWTGAGAVLTVGGVALLAGGMTLGLSYARGELEPPPQGTFSLLTMFVGGASMAFVGLPLLSAGWYMNQQLRRTIKGAEKVPRTVANEPRYWSAYAARMYGQGMMVTGGGSILLGVLAIVGVGALVGTEVYDPGLWAGVVMPFGAGATLIVGALVLQKAADAQMEAVRDRVDPRRQTSLRRGPDPLAFVPVVTGGRGRRPDGLDETRLGLAWAFAF
jgi:hypothetical protein